ncbi:unnamed protein product [Ambrosiozyma monospora]|uniref:Unnamed protein product n=1 Tax=Ambrosiozyma monospora TaxID=43982 RepID=A0ACB5TR57_AMBMO|nr:unnamed protein product [Ambrosiozyma monospora]
MQTNQAQNYQQETPYFNNQFQQQSQQPYNPNMATVAPENYPQTAPPDPSVGPMPMPMGMPMGPGPASPMTPGNSFPGPQQQPQMRSNSMSSLSSHQYPGGPMSMSGSTKRKGPSMRNMNTDSLLRIDDKMMNKTRRSSRLPSRMSTGNLYHLQNGLPSPGPSPQNPQYQQFPPQQQYGNSYYPPQQQFPRGQMPMGVPPPSSRHNSLSSGVSNRMFYFPNGEVFRPRAQSKNGHRQRPPPPRGSRPPTSPSFNQQQFQQFGPAPGQG